MSTPQLLKTITLTIGGEDFAEDALDAEVIPAAGDVVSITTLDGETHSDAAASIRSASARHALAEQEGSCGSVLVVEFLTRFKPREAPRAVDVGTGSGAIALACLSQHPTARFHAIDRSPSGAWRPNTCDGGTPQEIPTKMP